MASGFIDPVYDLSYKYFSQPSATSRGTLTGGGYIKNGVQVVANIKFTASTTATNSPQIIGGMPYPRTEVALSCIDITSGISSSITGSIPCGISTDGKVYMKEITSGHIYAISGAYIADS